VIAIAAIVTNVIGHFVWFFPIMVIIDGVYFFPLAHLFQVGAYYVTGTFLCLQAIVMLLCCTARNQHWRTLVGLGSMLILWITSLVILTMGRKLLHIARNQ